MKESMYVCRLVGQYPGLACGCAPFRHRHPAELSLFIVPLHPPQQPLYPRVDEAEYECDGNPIVPSQGRRGLHGILQGAGGGEYPG